VSRELEAFWPQTHRLKADGFNQTSDIGRRIEPEVGCRTSDVGLPGDFPAGKAAMPAA